MRKTIAPRQAYGSDAKAFIAFWWIGARFWVSDVIAIRFKYSFILFFFFLSLSLKQWENNTEYILKIWADSLWCSLRGRLKLSNSVYLCNRFDAWKFDFWYLNTIISGVKTQRLWFPNNKIISFRDTFSVSEKIRHTCTSVLITCTLTSKNKLVWEPWSG